MSLLIQKILKGQWKICDVLRGWFKPLLRSSFFKNIFGCQMCRGGRGKQKKSYFTFGFWLISEMNDVISHSLSFSELDSTSFFNLVLGKSISTLLPAWILKCRWAPGIHPSAYFFKMAFVVVDHFNKMFYKLLLPVPVCCLRAVYSVFCHCVFGWWIQSKSTKMIKKKSPVCEVLQYLLLYSILFLIVDGGDSYCVDLISHVDPYIINSTVSFSLFLLF